MDNEFIEGGCSGGEACPKSGDTSVSDFAGSSATIKNYCYLEKCIEGY